MQPSKQGPSDQTSNSFTSRRSRANSFREQYLLPRFIKLEDGTKRKLEDGEFSPNSELYPLSTPIKELSDFGIGIELGMYFTSVFWFGILMLCCGICQLPMAIYFNSDAYDRQNFQDRTWKVGASASCLDEQRVCLNVNCTLYAGEFHFPNFDMPRYAPDYDTLKEEWRDQSLMLYDDDHYIPSVHNLGINIAKADKKVVPSRDKFTVGLRDCPLQPWFGVSDFVLMLFTAVAVIALGRHQDREAEKLDLSEQTAQDYSVMIYDPTPDAIDPDQYKEWFEERFGPVFMVTVCLNNCELLRALKRKREIEFEMHLLDAQYSSNAGQANQHEQTSVAPNRKSLEKRLYEINLRISKLSTNTFDASKVFVIFESEHSQRNCLETMCVGIIPAALDRTDQIPENFLFYGNLLDIKEAPEPSSVLYSNLDATLTEQAREQIITWAILFVALAVAYFSIGQCFSDGQPTLGAILISFWNGALPTVIKFLVTFYESHYTLDDLENSFIAKTVAARCFCSSIILYLVGLLHAPQMLSPYFIGSIQATLMADAITSPLVRFADPVGNFNRFVVSRFAKSDEHAKILFAGTDYLLAERYTDVAKSILMSFFFSAIFPLGFFYTCFSCFVSFWVDKFCILRIFRRKPPANDKLVRTSRTFIALVVFAHCVVTSHIFYSWPFDNLCPSSEALSELGRLNAEAIGALSDFMFLQCNAQSSSFLPPVQDEPWFQEGGNQYRLVVFYKIASITTLCFICVSYFGFDAGLSLYALFWYKHNAVGPATDILFSSVENGQGFVPQFSVEGINHSILCCTAPEHGREGGLQFDTYLLNWTAAKEHSDLESENVFLTATERDSIYRSSNVYFDESLKNVPLFQKNGRLFAHAKQYSRGYLDKDEVSIFSDAKVCGRSESPSHNSGRSMRQIPEESKELSHENSAFRSIRGSSLDDVCFVHPAARGLSPCKEANQSRHLIEDHSSQRNKNCDFFRDTLSLDCDSDSGNSDDTDPEDQADLWKLGIVSFDRSDSIFDSDMNEGISLDLDD